MQESLKGLQEERERMQRSYVVQRWREQAEESLEKARESGRKGWVAFRRGWGKTREGLNKVFTTVHSLSLSLSLSCVCVCADNEWSE